MTDLFRSLVIEFVQALLLTFAQLGLHAELQVLAAVSGVDDAEQRGGRFVLESEGREEKSLIPPLVLQASLQQIW